jgi:hypothetical protein
VVRGCAHYRDIEDSSCPTDSGQEVVSDAELAVAMVSGAQEFDPLLIRCAAQLLSGAAVPVELLARLAIQERAVPAVRHIAQAAMELDAEHAARWQRLLALLPSERTAPPEGRLPHRSRFALQTGVRRIEGRLARGIFSVWLRPHSKLAERFTEANEGNEEPLGLRGLRGAFQGLSF